MPTPPKERRCETARCFRVFINIKYVDGKRTKLCKEHQYRDDALKQYPPKRLD